MSENRIPPIRLTDPETNETYVLEFNRETVKFAEARGFDISELLKYPETNIPALWFYAFRKNHKNVARKKTDDLLEELGGLTKDEIERLVALYNQTVDSLIVENDSEERKNSRLTVEL